MKKLLFISAITMCLGMVSCKDDVQKNETQKDKDGDKIELNSSGRATLAEIAAKAKSEGKNWSIDEWKSQIIKALDTARPIVKEMEKLREEDSKVVDDIIEACDDTENGRKLGHDEAFEEELKEKYGDLYEYLGI